MAVSIRGCVHFPVAVPSAVPVPGPGRLTGVAGQAPTGGVN
jgi:hypothetical protein